MNQQDRLNKSSFECAVDQLVFAEYFSIPDLTKVSILRSIARSAERRYLAEQRELTKKQGGQN